MRYSIEVGQRGMDGLWVWKVRPEGGLQVCQGLAYTRLGGVWAAKRASRQHARDGRRRHDGVRVSTTYDPSTSLLAWAPFIVGALLGIALLVFS